MDAPEISQFDHTRYYCGYSESWKSPLAAMLDEYTSMVRVEENVYRLCKKLCSAGIADSEGSDLFVVFISNDKKQIPLWHQKASHRADGVILWDYHVICVQRKADEKSAQVWDLDSTLPFPSPLTSYISETFRPSFPLFSEYQRFYRIIHAPLFLRYFASDRRHMKDSNGNWNAEPPTYNPIVAEDGTINNLNEYMEIHSTSTAPSIEADMVNIVKNERLGVVVSENQLEEFFTLPH